MVNTFVVLTPDEQARADYAASAERLDTARLRKQVVEAFQIYKALYQAERIAEMRAMDPLPAGAETAGKLYAARLAWLKRVVAAYNASSHRYVIIDGVLEERHRSEMPLKIHNADISGSTPFLQTNDDGSIVVWLKMSFFGRVRLPKGSKPTSRLCTLSEINTKLPRGAEIVASLDPHFCRRDCGDLSRGAACVARGSRIGVLLPRSQIALPDDIVFTLGYVNHTASRMWVGCLRSLQKYIDAHRDVYERRMRAEKGANGYTVRLAGYDAIRQPPAAAPPEHPWWVTDTSAVVATHFSSLLAKDQAYYGRTALFAAHKALAGDAHRYIWPSHLSADDIDTLASQREVPLTQLIPYLS